MLARRRRITAAVLLASYLLASAGAWLHSAHRHVLERCESADATLPCGCMQPDWFVKSIAAASAAELNSSRLHLEAGDTACPTLLITRRVTGPVAWIGQSLPLPHHHHDDCIVCRFQLTKKLIQLAPLAEALSVACPEPIVLDPPQCPMIWLPASPESRAPPAMA